MSERVATVREALRSHGQEHVLAFYDELDAVAQAALLDQIEGIDLERLDALIEHFVRHGELPAAASALEPAPYYAQGGDWDVAAARQRGRELIHEGRMAVFCVAGGQATRLGWSGPKGTFPGTVVTGKPLFRVLAEQIVATRNRYGTAIPFYIMTSPLNDADTRAFLLDNNCFGLSRRNIFMFPQGLLPSLDAETGRLLLADRGSIAMNPDGHGGSLNALARSGALDDMAARGIEHISYVQVDNPLVKLLDPVFIGLHVGAPDSSGEISSKMVVKTEPEEKVGVFCRVDGRTTVVEYTQLPKALAAQRGSDDQLRFRAGSIAVHLLSVEFVRRLTGGSERGGELALPLHAARKVVPFVDPATGELVTPETPNAIKLESFVFDALPLARASIVMETLRSEEFAPIKNARGADSPETSFQLQSDRAGAWLEAHGVEVPRDADGHVEARIELSPLTALDRADLARVPLPASIEPGAAVVL